MVSVSAYTLTHSIGVFLRRRNPGHLANITEVKELPPRMSCLSVGWTLDRKWDEERRSKNRDQIGGVLGSLLREPLSMHFAIKYKSLLDTPKGRYQGQGATLDIIAGEPLSS